MPARYSVAGPVNAGGASHTAVEIRNSATLRPYLYDYIFSCDGTPADNSNEVLVARTTTAGTSTAFTPVLLDPVTQAASSAGAITHSAEPTYTANSSLIDCDVNMRATFRWIAAPDGELIIAAGASTAGIGAKIAAVGNSNSTLRVECHFRE